MLGSSMYSRDEVWESRTGYRMRYVCAVTYPPYS